MVDRRELFSLARCIVRAVPEIVTHCSEQDLVIVGNTSGKKGVLECLERRIGKGVGADDFVLGFDLTRQE